ncbi:MAG TPA: hypothetical protein ACHBX0_02095 [Arsenophonus sp.]
MTAKNAINNTDKGQIVAGRDAILSAEQVNSNSMTLLATGIDSKGKFTTAGSLIIKGHKAVVLQGDIVAKENIVLTAGLLDLIGSNIQSKDITLTATESAIDTQKANIVAVNKAIFKTKKGINNQQGKLIQKGTADRLLHSYSLNNQQDGINLTGGASIVVNELNNQSGNLNSQGDLSLNVNKLENQKGTMVVAKTGSLILVARESIDNTQGTLFGEKILC